MDDALTDNILPPSRTGRIAAFTGGEPPEPPPPRTSWPNDGRAPRYFGHPIPLAVAADLADMRAACKAQGRTPPTNEQVVTRAMRLLPDDIDQLVGLLAEAGFLHASTGEQLRRFTCAGWDPAWPATTARLAAQLMRRGHQVPERRLFALAITLAVRDGL